jgi:hypothetical protein
MLHKIVDVTARKKYGNQQVLAEKEVQMKRWKKDEIHSEGNNGGRIFGNQFL